MIGKNFRDKKHKEYIDWALRNGFDRGEIQYIEKGIAENAIIRQTGCMGLCANEPTVEVIVPEMPAVIYGNVDEKAVEKIVEDHIINKKLVDNLILDRPAGDIVK